MMANLQTLAILFTTFLVLPLAAGVADEETPATLSSALEGEDACSDDGPGEARECDLSLRQLRGEKKQADVRAHSSASQVRDGVMNGKYVLQTNYDLSKDPHKDWDVVVIPDKDMTHSCSNYVDNGKTVFSRDGKLVLRVDSQCPDGGCLNSGRVMSKRGHRYGLFTFTATVPKCHAIWPALWLLPMSSKGDGIYGTWPCSGEIDLLETVDKDPFGAVNIVAGYGAVGGCAAKEPVCNTCAAPAYCTSTTFKPESNHSHYAVEHVDCSVGGHPHWKEHTFVLDWQPGQISSWVDPIMTYDADGHLVSIKPRSVSVPGAVGLPTHRVYKKESTETWQAADKYMNKCFKGTAHHDAPFDIDFKIVMNIAVGGYGGSPCFWGSNTCMTKCGKNIGAELVVSDLRVWEKLQ